ncbi:MAG: glycosyltransferase [Nitrospinae bacterium]|nr:glycosyltransferase [Nitrospinota bacterium]MZH04373.1 glycosyltransferase [Nitrospinota bacterium]MZH14831.1 glycosyltransferase [Nitrospinota bacterium]
MSSPLVSVIIPTFNRAYCLGESIQSVLIQKGYELIVVNDGSTDNTDQILSHFPAIKVIKYTGNRGVSFARNKGLEKAKGSLICFLDSDDLWEQGKLEAQVEWMRDHPECKAVYTDEIWIRNGVRVNPMNKHKKYSGDIFRQCLPLCIVSPSSVMLRKSVLDEVGGFDETMPVCEDYDLWLRIAARYPFKFLKEKLIVKRGGHEDQLSRKFWGMDRWRVYSLEKLLRGNELKTEQREWVTEMLIEKCNILIQGFEKRGKTEEAGTYKDMVSTYSKEAGFKN